MRAALGWSAVTAGRSGAASRSTGASLACRARDRSAVGRATSERPVGRMASSSSGSGPPVREAVGPMILEPVQQLPPRQPPHRPGTVRWAGKAAARRPRDGATRWRQPPAREPPADARPGPASLQLRLPPLWRPHFLPPPGEPPVTPARLRRPTTSLRPASLQLHLPRPGGAPLWRQPPAQPSLRLTPAPSAQPPAPPGGALLTQRSLRLRPGCPRGSLVRVTRRHAPCARIHLSTLFDPVVHKGVTGHRHEWITAPQRTVPRSVYAR